MQGVPVASSTSLGLGGPLPHFGHTAEDSLDKIDLQDMRYSGCCAIVVVFEATLADFWEIQGRYPENVKDEINALGKGDLIVRF